ncbi:MAG: hypothetical protein ACP5G2_06135 [Candidatus Bipolaricaulaceae bacterium]
MAYRIVVPCESERCPGLAVLGIGRSEQEALEIARRLSALGRAYGLCPQCGRWRLYQLGSPGPQRREPTIEPAG